MNRAIVAKTLKIASIILVGLAVVIAGFEWRRPSPRYWWRAAAESILTEFSGIAEGSLGFSASKLAFRLRGNLAKQVTVERLANSAERHEQHRLSAISRVLLVQDSSCLGEDSLALASQAFSVSRCELTAWQYASCLQRAGKAVPEEVIGILAQGVEWDFSRLVLIDQRPDKVVVSLRLRGRDINDGELRRLADTTKQSEGLYSYWSRSDIQLRTLFELRTQLERLRPIADQNALWVFLSSMVKDWILRSISGVFNLFAGGPDLMDFSTLVSRTARRFMTVVDALQAVAAAAEPLDQLYKAREAVTILEQRIGEVQSGRMVQDLGAEMTSHREMLIARLHQLLRDHRRYSVDESFVLAAIDGEDPNQRFLNSAARHGRTY